MRRGLHSPPSGSRLCCLRRGLSPDDANQFLALADGDVELNWQADKKRRPLRGRTIINCFFESTTRTQTSFEVAGHRADRGRQKSWPFCPRRTCCGTVSIEASGDPIIIDRLRNRHDRPLLAPRQLVYPLGHVAVQVGDRNRRQARPCCRASHPFNERLGEGAIIPFVPLQRQLLPGGGGEHDNPVLRCLKLVGEFVYVRLSVGGFGAQHPA